MAILRSVTPFIAATLVAQACASPEGGAGPGASDAADATAMSDGGHDTVDETAGFIDEDDDTVRDEINNCVGLFNPDQADVDHDGIGNVCDSENDDRDDDGIPNGADPFPDDATRPGVVKTDTVYAHTADELYLFGVKGQLQVERVGAFQFDAATSDARMTDIAIDRYGVMWGIGFADVFVIDPKTAKTWRLASLPQEFNGLTLVPRETLGTGSDALIGIDTSGGWWRLDLIQQNGTTRVQTTRLGGYGSWTSSGDAFSIAGVGTFASVDRDSDDLDQLVMLDPETGLVTQVISAIDGYSTIWGLAGWAGRVYAFDAGGDVLVLDLASGAVTARVSTGKAWWGAGVRTVLDE